MKPILFNTDMVRAILNGHKTVTRRVVKPQPENAHAILDCDNDAHAFDLLCGETLNNGALVDYAETVKAPYWPGDILYVRETFHQTPNGQYWYKADDLCTGQDGFCIPYRDRFHKICTICRYYGGLQRVKWCPSIHMPRKAARIFLRVTDVRVERLQDITPESCASDGGFDLVAVDAVGIEKLFGTWWDNCIKKSDRPIYGWAANPWVWVIEFERINMEEEMM